MKNIDKNGNPLEFLKMVDIIKSKKYELSKDEVIQIFSNIQKNGLKDEFLQFGHRVFIEKSKFDAYYEKYMAERGSLT